MPRYWVIAPVESNPPELFDKVWKADLEHGCISIGWYELGDVSELNREQLQEKVSATFPEKPPATCSLIANMFWAFFHEIQIGDIILARRGRKRLAGVGVVTATAGFETQQGGRLAIAEHTHHSFLGVKWQEKPRDTLFPFIAFPMYTLAEFSDDQYKSVVELPPAPDIVIGEVEELAVAGEAIFVLEKYLEDFIVSNFDTIFAGQLKIFTDTEGYFGQQYSTDIGPIDILAVEPSSNAFVVIELKRNRSSDQVVGQILRYMGWVSEKLCSRGQIVKGLVICRSADTKLNYAISMTKNIDVKLYSVSFKLSDNS